MVLLQSDQVVVAVAEARSSTAVSSPDSEEVAGRAAPTYSTFDDTATANALLHQLRGNRAPTPSRRWAQWVFASVFVLSLGWVCFWAVADTHTTIAREWVRPSLYPDNAPLLDQKTWARIFTYLGVLYLWLGFVSCAALIVGIRLPKPAPWMVRTCRCIGNKGPCCSRLEAGAAAVFCAVLVASFLTRVFSRFEFAYWPAERYWYEIGKTFGKLASIILAVILLPVSKSCFFWDVFNYHFERALKLHRWLAWLLVWIVVAHALTEIISLVITGQFQNCMWPNEQCEKPGGWGTWKGLETSRIFTYGWVTVLIAAPLVVTSLPWFRRKRFEWFYYTHFLFVPFFVVLSLHYTGIVYYLAPGLAAYVLDKVVWWCASRRPTKIVSLSVPARGFVRIEIALDRNYRFEPGNWVQIKIPAVSALEWHPMSVASAPGHSTITIDAKVLGDWTERLARFAKEFDPTRLSHTCIFLDKFHGSSHELNQGYLTHPAVLLFAGGIGITPMLSAFRQLIEDSSSLPHIRRAVLVWCCKKKSVVDLYREELARFQSLGTTSSGCEVQVIVHVTLSEKETDDGDDGNVDEEKQVVVDAPALPSSSSSEDDPQIRESSSCNRKRQGPFMQHVMGYGHLLVLTTCAGVGCLLGILAASALAVDKDWRAESVSFLQLLLAVLLTGILALCAMSASLFRPTVEWEEEEDGHPADCASTGPPELSVVLGCRPDIPRIVGTMKNYCSGDGRPPISTVGVSVCGPEKMVHSVLKESSKASTSSLQFIVDEETFEW